MGTKNSVEVSFDFDLLTEEEILPNEFLLLVLLKDKKFSLINKIRKNLFADPFSLAIDRMKALGYIEGGESTYTMELTDKSKELLEGKGIFEELLNRFPTSVVRIDGKKDYLKTDKKRSKKKYLRLTRNRKDIHLHILECLDYELTYRKSRDEMKWMKKLPNWIDSEEWKTWGDRMKEERFEDLKVKILGTEENYGEGLE